MLLIIIKCLILATFHIVLGTMFVYLYLVAIDSYNHTRTTKIVSTFILLLGPINFITIFPTICIYKVIKEIYG